MEMPKIYVNPPRSEWPALTARCTRQEEEIGERVAAILAEVRTGGDAALRRIVRRIEGYLPETFEVTRERRAEAAKAVSPQLKAALEQAKANIEAFHRAQLPAQVEVETMPGVRCVQRAVAIGRAGLYIPGGKAPLFSTVLMLALPARIAGCREVILCTPCGRDGRIAPEILYAADLCGVDRVFALGGAQAVAAMAYGTESNGVNRYPDPHQRELKAQLAGAANVAVDLPAGPSEVLVLADEDARPEFAAADLLSQAEHGDDSQAVLVCRSEEFAQRAIASVGEQAARLSRRDAIGNSLANSRIVVFSDPDEQIAFADAYAPEHLIVAMRDAWDAAARITAAGSVFIGGYSPESAGDYASGTNHTLPTGGWARAYSGVNTESFMRKITYQELTRGGLEALAPTITAMAEAEGLDAHANAVRIRTEGGAR
ncbi:MAG: histidinol dehydrogenase [Alistipes sp. 58_9_plus]|nr:MAG: histidinol dehydrogenase [Alistipes sp. 58_9_plus]